MNKEEQKKILVEMMEEDEKLGLYKQQTAVDWLFNELIRCGYFEGKYCKPVITFEQAKKKEREQTIMAYATGYVCDERYVTGESPKNVGLRYYNETYGKLKVYGEDSD